MFLPVAPPCTRALSYPSPGLRSHIADQRKPADQNRVPDPNDIIASVLVRDGKVFTEQGGYEPGAHHRLVTMDGVMKLSEGLMALLQQALVRVRGMEKEIVGQGKQ